MAPPSSGGRRRTTCPTCPAPPGGPAGSRSLSPGAPADAAAVGPRLATGRLPTDRCPGSSRQPLRGQEWTWCQPRSWRRNRKKNEVFILQKHFCTIRCTSYQIKCIQSRIISTVYLSNDVLSASYPMRKLSSRTSPCSSLPARAFFNVPLRSSSFITATVISGFLCLAHVYK